MPFERSGRNNHRLDINDAGTLKAVYRRVRERLLARRDGLSVRKRRARESVRTQELQALGDVLDELGARFASGVVVSRFAKRPAEFGESAPVWRFVVDIDGIENFLRGLPGATLSLAMTRPEQPLGLAAVEVSLVGTLEADCSWFAVRGKGAWHRGSKVRATTTELLDQAFVGTRKSLEGARAIRHFGSPVFETVAVASGSLDACVSTGVAREAAIAAGHIVEQAGGSLWALPGVPMVSMASIPSRIELVAAATPQLAQAICEHCTNYVGATGKAANDAHRAQRVD